MGCVYKLISPTNKIYIGKTKHTVEFRFKQHVQIWRKLNRREETYRNTCPKLYWAFDKYDPSLWTHEILFESDNENELNLKEIELIEKYDTIKNGYNITKGGDGRLVNHLEDEHKQKIAQARLDWFHTEEGLKYKEELKERYTNKNPSIIGIPGFTGKKHTEETKEKIRNTVNEKITDGTYVSNFKYKRTKEHNKITSERTKQLHLEGKIDYAKMAEAKKGFKQTDYQKEAVAKALSKTFKIITPQGEELVITNLQKFCRDNNLDQGNMTAVSKGRQKTCKGYQCFRLN